MKKTKSRLYTGIIGLCIILGAVFTGCEAGLTSSSDSSSGDGSDGFSFSEMYANISDLKNEISNLRQVINSLNSQVGMASPAGTIVPFAGPEASIPEGWLLCNGDPVDRDLYPALFQAIGISWGDPNSYQFNLPDLQGRFLRGLDTSGSIDPDGGSRNVGSYQDDAFQDHMHEWSFRDANPENNSDHEYAWDTNDRDLSGWHRNNTSGSVNGRYAAETRPTNAAVNYIIKY
ncbi:MAG: tail fiber protein [bacterium]|nr:tail fiber protein [bacterium]